MAERALRAGDGNPQPALASDDVGRALPSLAWMTAARHYAAPRCESPHSQGRLHAHADRVSTSQEVRTMGSRKRPEHDKAPEQEPRQAREREAPTKKQERDGEYVRVPKIQYRFLKLIEEKGITQQMRASALTMADKIRRYPLRPFHVMNAWERHTRVAIADFKARRGNQKERDDEHCTYAVMFSAVRSGRPVENVAELKERIRKLAEPRGQHEPAREGTEASTRVQEPSTVRKKSPEQAARAEPQRGQLELDQAKHAQPEREQPGRDRKQAQIEEVLANLDDVPASIRRRVQDAATRLIIATSEAKLLADQAFPKAYVQLQQAASKDHLVQALTLAAVASTKTHDELLTEIGGLPQAEQRLIHEEAQRKVERCSSVAAGLEMVKNDQARHMAAMVIDPNDARRRSAYVDTLAREQLEARTETGRSNWSLMTEQLAVSAA